MKKLLLFLIILVFPIIVNADDSFVLTCDKTDKINIQEQIICRVSVNSTFNHDKISFKVESSEGFSIVDVRSNYEKRWHITNNNGIYSASSEELQYGLQEFGIVLLKATKSGLYDLKISNIVLENTKEEDEEKTNTREFEESTVSLKVISSDNGLKEIKINDTPIDNFDSNLNNYVINVTDEESLTIEVVSNNEYATINGNGEFKLNEKTNTHFLPISVLSEDGVSKIYLLSFINKNFVSNNIDKSLDSIVIKNDKGNNLLIDFKSNIYEYNIEVELNTKYLEINPILSNKELSFVKGYGSVKKELLSGDNIVIIKVQDKEGEVLNYVLNITKPIANKSGNNYIKNLYIDKYKLDFAKRVKNYTLYIKRDTKSLVIKPVLESESAKYIISGNNNLKEGSQIKITVTAENGEKTTYKINIKIKKTNYTKYIIAFIILAILGVGGYKLKDTIIKLLPTIKEKVMEIYKEYKKSETKKTTKPKTTTKKKTTTKPKSTSNAKKNTTTKKKGTTSSKKKTTSTKKPTTKKTTTTKKNTTTKPKTNSTKSNTTKKKTTSSSKANSSNAKKNTTNKKSTSKTNTKKK